MYSTQGPNRILLERAFRRAEARDRAMADLRQAIIILVLGTVISVGSYMMSEVTGTAHYAVAGGAVLLGTWYLVKATLRFAFS